MTSVGPAPGRRLPAARSQSRKLPTKRLPARVEELLESVSATDTADNEPAQGTTGAVRRGERSKVAEDGPLPAKTNQTARVD